MNVKGATVVFLAGAVAGAGSDRLAGQGPLSLRSAGATLEVHAVRLESGNGVIEAYSKTHGVRVDGKAFERVNQASRCEIKTAVQVALTTLETRCAPKGAHFHVVEFKKDGAGIRIEAYATSETGRDLGSRLCAAPLAVTDVVFSAGAECAGPLLDEP